MKKFLAKIGKWLRKSEKKRWKLMRKSLSQKGKEKKSK